MGCGGQDSAVHLFDRTLVMTQVTQQWLYPLGIRSQRACAASALYADCVIDPEQTASHRLLHADIRGCDGGHRGQTD